MSVINKRLFRLVADTRGQFTAVALVMSVGLALNVALSVSALDMEAAMRAYYRDQSFADIAVAVESISDAQIGALSEIDGVEAAEGRASRVVPFITGEGNEKARVLLLTLTNDVNRVALDSGRMPEAGRREVLVIKQFADARGVSAGDAGRLQVGGRTTDFYVSGLVNSPEFVYLVDPRQGLMPDNVNYGVVFIERELGARLMGRDGYNEVLFLAGRVSGRELDDVAETLEDRMERYGARRAETRDRQISNVMLSQEIEQLRAMSTGIPALFLTISALVITMMLARMVRRDRQAIGVMKALGYSSADLMAHYMKYSLLLAAAGGAAGVFAGLPLGNYQTDYYMTFFRLPNIARASGWSPALSALAMAFSCCAAAGFIGARGILRVAPAEAMRQEAPARGGRIWLENFRPLWAALSFGGKMAMKNVFRNKKRAFFGASAVAITFSLTVFTLAMPETIDAMMGDGLRELRPMDYDVMFESELSPKALRELRAEFPGVERIEGKAEIPCEITNGARDVALSVIGVERGSNFYLFRDKAGRAVPSPGDGVLLSDYAARKLRVRVGDTVRIHSYLYEKEDRLYPVSGVVYQPLGTNAYMDADRLARDFLEPGVVTGCVFDLDEPDVVLRLMELPAVASVSSLRDAQAVMGEYTQVINAFLALLIALSGLLGGVVIYSVSVINIGERETEFSTLRVLGMSQGEIFALLLRENGVITLLGLAAGFPLTRLLLAYYNDIFSTEQYTMVTRASWGGYARGAALTACFVALAQGVTWRRIKKLDFLSALKDRA